jgi:two-component system NtrC family response regulator
LNLFLLEIPPLRERKEDILLLAKYFLIDASRRLNKENLKFSNQTIRLLEQYEFPGNIRELENTIHRAAILCKTKTIESENLPDKISKKSNSNVSASSLNSLPFKEAKEKVITEFELNYIKSVLKECNGVVSRAAAKMGMHKKNLYEKFDKYGINPSSY